MPGLVLRFKQLKERGIVRSRPQLRNLIAISGFPQGRLLSPNCRVWTEEEVDAWFESRPVENDRPLQGVAKKLHESATAA